MTTFDEGYPFDWVFLEPAREQYLALSESDRADFDRLAAFLCRDPWEDGQIKAPLVLDDGTLVTLYDDGRWQIIYLLIASRVIEIWAISLDWFGAG